MTLSIIVCICSVVNIVLAFYWLRMFAGLRKRRQRLEELVDKYKFGLIDAYADGGKIITKVMRLRIVNMLENIPPEQVAVRLMGLIDEIELRIEELRKEKKEAIKNGESSVPHTKNN